MSKSVEEIKNIIGTGENVEELAIILIAELESRSLNMLEVIVALEQLLTSDDKELRGRGTKILARLLLPHVLTQSDCSHLVTFFLQRLQDHYSIVPSALAGLAALTAMDKCPEEAAPLILDGLQQNVICQTLTVSHRYTFYTIFHNIFMKNKKKVASDMPVEFLGGLVSGMSSERDPRNLLYLFSFLPAVLSYLPLQHLKEDVFTVLESYFPVDYNPIGEKDPITREDLARSLECCLTSSPELGDLCLPLIIEKLDSSVPLAQADALKLLIGGVSTWGVESVSRHMDEICSALRGLLLSSQLSVLARETLLALLKAFTLLPLTDDEIKAFYFLLKSLLSWTHGFLNDPGLSLFLPTVKLLVEAAAVSSTTADFIIPQVLPQLLALLESDCSYANKETVLKSLYPLLQTSIRFNSWKSEACREHLEGILPVLMKLLPHPETCGAAFLCISEIHSKTDQSAREYIYNLIKKMMLLDLSKNTRIECGRLIRVLAEAYPEEVQNTFLSAFSFPGEDWDEATRARVVELLLSLMEAEPLAVPTANLFLKFISEEEYSQWRPITVLSLREKYEEKEGVLGKAAREFPLVLLQKYTSRPPDQETIAAARLISLILCDLSTREQSEIMLSGLQVLDEENTDPTTLLVVMEGLLSGLRQEVEVPDIAAFSLRLLKFSLSAETPLARTSAARLLALFINKSSSDEVVSGVLESASSLIVKNAASVELQAWLTKSLLLRSHSQAGAWLDQLLNLTFYENIGIEAAQGVRLVLEENPVFSARNFCNIGILYKQRVFEKFKLLISPSGETSKAASLALAYILKYSPSSLVVGHFGKLGGVMVNCLEVGEDDVTRALLDILSSLLQAALPELTSYTNDFIPRFIKLAKHSPVMAVRCKALDCIYFYGGFKVEDILLYKPNVLLELQPCLDDKKRLVRQSAVRARTKWFAI